MFGHYQSYYTHTWRLKKNTEQLQSELQLVLRRWSCLFQVLTRAQTKVQSWQSCLHTTVQAVDRYWHADIYLLITWASGKCRSAETKVWKWKYRNQSMEVRRKADYRCLVPYWLTNVCVFSQRWLCHCNVRAGSWALGLQWASLSRY